MKTSARYLSISLVAFSLAASAAIGDIRIDLIKGKRAVTETVSFTIEVSHERNEDPRNQDKPDFI